MIVNKEKALNPVLLPKHRHDSVCVTMSHFKLCLQVSYLLHMGELDYFL